MRACAGCFRDQGPLPLTVDDGAFGKCDLCDRAGVQVWDVALWSDHVARILDMYEPSDAPSARPIHERVAHDWELFTFDDLELVHGFLEAALGGQGVYELLDSREPVLPRYDEDGVAADHKSRWDEFRTALIAQNRYFPAVDFDLQYLRQLVEANLGTIVPGLQLYRARAVSVGDRLPMDKMGVPPANRVSGGRGNPVELSPR